MSVAISSMVFDCCPYGGNLGLLARSLADSCPDHTGEKMFRAVETLAHTSCQNARTVQRGLARMVQDGWLIMIKRGGGFRGASSQYKINPAWLYAVQQERALAAQTNSLPRKIGVLHNLPLRGDTGEVMGDSLSPITVDNPCLNIEHTHDKNASIDDKNASIDDTAVSPKQEHEHNTPLPPTGGEEDFENLKTKEEFASVVAAYPRKHRADVPKAWELYRKLPCPAARMASTLALIDLDAHNNESWTRDGGKWIPKLSKWLAGLAVLNDLCMQAQATEVPPALRGATAPAPPPSKPPTPEDQARNAAAKAQAMQGMSQDLRAKLEKKAMARTGSFAMDCLTSKL